MPAKKPPRRYGIGSVYRFRDGYRALGMVAQPDGSRKRQAFCAATAEEAADLLAAARQAGRQGLPTAPERQTVAAFLTWWLEEVHRPHLAGSSYEHQEMLVRVHLSPGLGHHQLGRLSAQHVAAFYAQKTRDGYSPGYVRQMHAVLTTALNAGVRWDLLPRNVAALVTRDLPKAERPVRRVLDVAPAQRFLAAVAGERLGALYTVALYCGLRRGELAGLRWVDVDLDGAQLHVQQKHLRVLRQLVEDLPKGGKARTLDVPLPVVEALRAHRKQQAVERLAAPGWERPDLVFVDGEGRPLNPSALNTNYLKPFLKRAGLDTFNMHELRHSCATLLLADGADLAAVAQFLGHADPSITLRIYRSILPSERGRVAERLGKLLAPPPTSTEQSSDG